MKISKSKLDFFDDKKFLHHKFAEHIQDTFHVKMIDDGYIYDGGYYKLDRKLQVNTKIYD